MTASSPRRILSVWLRRLPTDRIERASRAPDNSPLVLTAAIKSAQRIVALNDSSAALGLRMGMALADARAMYPALNALEAKPDEDRRLLDAIADWCDRYTPLVGLDSPDGLFLDVSGCAHLFGGEAILARDLTQRLRGQGLRSRAAIADSAGCAWALARYGDCAVVPPGVLREVLLPLPLAALRLDTNILESLKTAGLLKIRDIIDLPRAPLAARFSNYLLQRLDQATGREDESIVPRLPVPSYVVERRFADPIGREEDVLGTLQHLAQELARAMERHGEGACRLQAARSRAYPPPVH